MRGRRSTQLSSNESVALMSLLFTAFDLVGTLLSNFVCVAVGLIIYNGEQVPVYGRCVIEILGFTLAIYNLYSLVHLDLPSM